MVVSEIDLDLTGVTDLQQLYSKQTSKHIEVGLFSDQYPHLPEEGYEIEFGTATITPKPFIRNTVEQNRSKYQALLNAKVKESLEDQIDLEIGDLGKQAVLDIEDTMQTRSDIPELIKENIQYKEVNNYDF